jgi:hypothetical protein
LSKKQQQYEEHPGTGMEDDVVVAASGDPLTKNGSSSTGGLYIMSMRAIALHILHTNTQSTSDVS